jgi:crotonobetainyl-CoA:carnitine CoA-transferase CaiB-like acyl-CoA transferase
VTRDEVMPRALEGLKVLEVADGIAGPYCGKLLADLGAEVIKVERPREGDPLRYRAPFYHDEPSPDGGLLFNFLNTSKLGVTLGVAMPAGLGLLQRLAQDADVLLVGGQPAEIEAGGLGFEAWQARQPRLVCTYVTPFGMTGPYRDRKGGELVAFHMSGLGLATPRDRLSVEGRRPLKGAEHQALMVAGLNAAAATMHGLFARDASGRGQMVDVSELEPLASYQFLQIARWTYAGDDGDRGYGEGSRGFFASDGGIAMLLFTGQMQQWEAFKELMGNPEWLSEGGYKPPISRIPEDDPFWSRLNHWSTQFTKEQLYRKAQGLRVPLFPENTVPEAVESEQVRSRDFVQAVPLANGASTGAPVAPYQMYGTPARPSGPPPSLGRDNRLVFCERLGLSEEELVNAYAAGVI